MNTEFLPDHLIKTLPSEYSQDYRGMNAIVYIHYLHAKSGWHWGVLEGHKCRIMGSPNFKFFGFIIGEEIEFCYFLRSDLEETGVVRDIKFRPCRVKEFIPKLLGNSWRGVAFL